MKKAIAILAVLVLVASAVFAGNAEVKIRSKVTTEPEPAKPLYFRLIASLTPERAVDALANDGSSTVLNAEGQNVASIKDEDITVYFSIVQVERAGNNQVCTFSITATKMYEVEKNAADVYVKKENGASTRVVSIIEKHAGEGFEDIVSPVNNKDEFSVHYNGEVAGGSTLATFDVKWEKDDTIPDGLYEASVVVNFTTE